jgi:ABC-type taurine transport system substrate-binding protein
MDYYFNADVHLQEEEGKIEYLKSIEAALREIMDNIKWRHSTIRNIIDWRRFTSGG